MAFDQIIDLAKGILEERKMGAVVPLVEALRPHGSLPGSVMQRRSLEAGDDLATALVLADGVELVELRKRVRPGVLGLGRHPRHLVEAWAMCETLRRLGFSQEEIAVGWGSVTGQGDDVVFANISAGGVKMTVCISRFPADSAAEALAGWAELWEDIVAAGDDDLAVLLARTAIGEYPRLVALVAELARQGIGVPAAPGRSGPLTLLAGPAINLTQGGKS